MYIGASCGILGALVLYYFYRLLETRWPANYFTAAQYVDYAVSLSLPRYATFRLLPPYAVGVLASGTAVKYGGNAAASILTVSLLHIVSTSGRSLISNARGYQFRRGQAAIDVAITLSCTLTFAAAYFSYIYFLPVVPGGEKYVEALLIGSVAAAVTTQLQKFLSQAVDVEQETRRQIAQLPTDLKRAVLTAAAHVRADRSLVLAVLVTELIQRRKWTKRFEIAGGKVGLAETFGAMQGSNDPADSEEESARKAVARLVTEIPLRQPQVGVSRQVLEYHLERHNQGKEFLELVPDPPVGRPVPG